MGDLTGSTPPAPVQDEPKTLTNVPGPPPIVPSNPSVSAAAYTEGPPPTLHQPAGQQAFASQFEMQSPAQPSHSGPYNMPPMATSLPQVQYRPGQYPIANQQRYGHPTSPPMMPQMQPMSHYGHSPSMNMAPQGYYIQQQPHIGQFYAGGQVPTSQSQPQGPPRQNMGYYPHQMMMNQPQAGYYYPPQPTQYPTPNQGVPAPVMPRQYHHSSQMPAADPRSLNKAQDELHLQEQAGNQGQEADDRRQSTVRGPPRKPRQSGHAIWIGNLPPQTDLMSLVHHVCKEAVGLESLFLISKSNCAFANFKDEKTCAEAQQRLHDSKFQAVKLVSRLRKMTNEHVTGTTPPTGPASTTTNLSVTSGEDVSSVSPSDAGSSNSATPAQQTQQTAGNALRDAAAQQDKFFILKSLTVEDLELSVRTGIWATQSHNEESLNKAFLTVDNVYLVFSANKSGEYFGYARMLSQIDDDPAAAIEFAPKVQTTSDMDLPKAIATEATDHAPRGRIIDDSARGTIFWEVDRDDSEAGSDNESGSGSGGADEEEETKTWGKPFKLEWQSTARLPFYRTRGLRNPWNSNREVKIARDGTELEPSIGRKLISLFNKPPNHTAFSPYGRPPVGMAPGYPTPRPYGP